MEFHELADIFPMMSPEEFAALKADIAENGLFQPIWTWQGKIVDGRNRYNACVELYIEPQFQEWNGQGSLVDFIISMNLHRRHLSESQRAMVGAKIATLSKGRPDYLKNTPIGAFNKSSAGSLLNIGRTSIDRAKKVISEGTSGLAQAVEQGKVSVSLAARATELPEQEQRDFVSLVETGTKPKEAFRQAKRSMIQKKETALPSNKFRVIYADPPWQYGDNGVITECDNYGRAERHYPTMSLVELCEMGDRIKDLTTDNAVLFLWTTSPILEDSFKVINAWGFKYKTSFIWDKVRHNFGHYNSVRHELLLICTKGSCTPDSDQKLDSVVVCERTDEHSEKPGIFREIIDGLYIWGNRIELFARKEHPNWVTWGNEV